jgi:hypothetical protein
VDDFENVPTSDVAETFEKASEQLRKVFVKFEKLIPESIQHDEKKLLKSEISSDTDIQEESVCESSKRKKEDMSWNILQSNKSSIEQTKNLTSLCCDNFQKNRKSSLSKSEKINTKKSLQSSASVMGWNSKNWLRHVHNYFSKKKDIEDTKQLFLDFGKTQDLSKISPTKNPKLFRVRLDNSKHRIIFRGEILFGVFVIESVAFFNYEDHKSYENFLDLADKDEIEFHESNITEVNNMNFIQRYILIYKDMDDERKGIEDTEEEQEESITDIFAEVNSLIEEKPKPIIAYHGSTHPIKKFDRSFSAQGVFWFSDDKDKILRGESGAASTKYIIQVQLNVKNPAGRDEYEKYGLDEIEQRGFDSIKLEDDWVIFDRKKIKILKIEKVDDLKEETIDEAKKRKKKQIRTGLAAFFGKGDGKSGATIPAFREPGVASVNTSGVTTVSAGVAPMVSSKDWDGLDMMINESTLTNPYTEAKKNPDHAYHAISKDSEVVTNTKYVGIDNADRKTYSNGKYYFVWDSLHGDWEVFSMRKFHKGSMRDSDFGKFFLYKKAINGRKLNVK